MEGSKLLRNSQIIILGFCIAFATIVASGIISKGLLKLKKFSTEVISVTGSGEKTIVSDYVVWKARFSRRDLKITDAYAKVKEDLKLVKEYLLSKGMKEEEIIIAQIDTRVLYRKNQEGYETNDIDGYLLSQEVEVRSFDVQKISEVSRMSTELINRGIEFISQPPEYFYTKLSELKMEMLAIATQDAKKRAMNMATATGNKIGFMHSASMGVFQITPVNSFEVAGYGVNDTSSLEKKVTAVVHADFAIKD